MRNRKLSACCDGRLAAPPTLDEWERFRPNCDELDFQIGISGSAELGTVGTLDADDSGCADSEVAAATLGAIARRTSSRCPPSANRWPGASPSCNCGRCRRRRYPLLRTCTTGRRHTAAAPRLLGLARLVSAPVTARPHHRMRRPYVTGSPVNLISRIELRRRARAIWSCSAGAASPKRFAWPPKPARCGFAATPTRSYVATSSRSASLSRADILDTSTGGCCVARPAIMTDHSQPPVEFADDRLYLMPIDSLWPMRGCLIGRRGGGRSGPGHGIGR